MRHQTTKAIYIFVCQYYDEHGFGPTQQEIADSCFVVRSGVSRHLDKLAAWGWVSRTDGKARGLRPLKLLDEIETQLSLPKF